MKKILNILCTAIAAVLLCGGIAGCAPQTYGTFYTLEEAYEAGILTHDELMSIAYYHNGGTRGNEAIMGEELCSHTERSAGIERGNVLEDL